MKATLTAILKHHSNAIICKYRHIESIPGGNIIPEEPDEGMVTAVVKATFKAMLIANLKHH